MEGAVCAVFGVCAFGGRVGGECGMFISFYLSGLLVDDANGWTDGYGPQIYHSGLSVSDAIYGSIECFIQWVDHVKVR